jgi:hypothetical protein
MPGAIAKRALLAGDSESFPFERRRRADLGNSAADVAISECGLPPGDIQRRTDAGRETPPITAALASR